MNGKAQQARIEHIRQLATQLQQAIDSTGPPDNAQLIALIDRLCMELICYLNHLQ